MEPETEGSAKEGENNKKKEEKKKKKKKKGKGKNNKKKKGKTMKCWGQMDERHRGPGGQVKYHIG